MKKMTSVFLAILLVLSFASCSKAKAKGGGGESRTITWMTVRPLYQNAMLAITEICEAYTALHPDFKVEFQSIQDRPSYYQKLKILASNKDLPEIFDAEGDSLTAQIASTGVLADIDELYKELNYDRMLNIGLNYSRLADGKLYCLSWENNVEYIWYHKDLFAKAGIPKTPETFDELLDACQKLKAAGITPIATWGNEAWPLLRWLAFMPFRLRGNEYIETLKLGKSKMAEPVGIQTAQFFQTLGTNYFQPGWATADYDGALDTFLSGNAAMYYIGSWQFNSFMGENRELKDDYGFMYMPTLQGAINGKTDMWAHAGTGTALRKDTLDDQMKDFVKYLLEQYPEKVWAETKTFPSMSFDTSKGGLSSFEQHVMDDSEALTSYGYCWDVRMDAASTEVMTKEIINLGMGSITPQEFASRVDAAIAVNAPKFFEGQ